MGCGNPSLDFCRCGFLIGSLATLRDPLLFGFVAASLSNISSSVVPLSSDERLWLLLLSLPGDSGLFLKAPGLLDLFLIAPGLLDLFLTAPGLFDLVFKAPGLFDLAFKAPGLFDLFFKAPGLFDRQRDLLFGFVVLSPSNISSYVVSVSSDERLGLVPLFINPPDVCLSIFFFSRPGLFERRFGLLLDELVVD